MTDTADDLDLIRLPDLPRRLAEHGAAVSHMKAWRAAVAGSIPATRRGSRWLFAPADLPAIAAAFTADR